MGCSGSKRKTHLSHDAFDMWEITKYDSRRNVWGYSRGYLEADCMKRDFDVLCILQSAFIPPELFTGTQNAIGLQNTKQCLSVHQF